MSNVAADTTGLPPLRLISIAWGEEYVACFLDLCLPAVLAPGNLPVLIEHFAVELVLVTEEAAFDQVKRHPAYASASALCRVRLVALDDLIGRRDSYCMSITYAFYRGFEDLGPGMTNCYMVFIHADFILADGSYRGLLPHLLRGERLVFAPSYCTEAEAVRPQLEAAINIDGTLLAIQPREMAEMILRHRHLSVRAKTVNQKFFSTDIIEQYYWIVDEHTLLTRQFPVALVAMKPECYVRELGAIWDYGVIADFCPSMKFSALSDSDDYLMLELRERDNPKGRLSLGWPTMDKVAKEFFGVITDYTVAFGKTRFTVHSRDLTNEIEQAHDALDAVVSEVLNLLPGKIPSRHQHIQWIIHYERFHALRLKYLTEKAQRGKSVQHINNVETGISCPGDLLFRGSEKTRTNFLTKENLETLGTNFLTKENLETLARYRSHPAISLQLANMFNLLAKHIDLASYFGGKFTLQEHRSGAHGADMRLSIGGLENLVKDIEKNATVAIGAARQFLELDLGRIRSCLAEARNAEVAAACTAEFSKLEAQDAPFLQNRDSQKNTGLQHVFKKILQFIIGKPGAFRLWHWMHSCTRFANALVSERLNGKTKSDILLLRGGFAAIDIPCHINSLTTIPMASEFLELQFENYKKRGITFDTCIVDGDIRHFKNLSRLYEQLRPLLKPNGTFIGLFLNPMCETFPRQDIGFIRDVFPVCGPARTMYTGSKSATLALLARHFLVSSFAKPAHIHNIIIRSIAFLVATPFSLCASFFERHRTLDNSYQPPRNISAVLIEIIVGQQPVGFSPSLRAKESQSTGA